MKVSNRQKCSHCGNVFNINDKEKENIVRDIKDKGFSVVICSKCDWDFNVYPKKENND